MTDLYRRQADKLAALLAKGYSLRVAAEIVAQKRKRKPHKARKAQAIRVGSGAPRITVDEVSHEGE
jgi:hypothetical protein